MADARLHCARKRDRSGRRMTNEGEEQSMKKSYLLLICAVAAALTA